MADQWKKLTKTPKSRLWNKMLLKVLGDRKTVVFSTPFVWTVLSDIPMVEQ